MMRKILIVVFALIAVQGAFAQSAKRRAEQAEAQARKSNQNQLSTRAQISFPTQAEMQEDVVWRRDVYREIDLTQDANAGLYYPVEPQGTQMMILGFGAKSLFGFTMRMNCFSICSVTVKSAITPSFSGRTATMLPGVRPMTALASWPTQRTSSVLVSTATTEGSRMMMPLPRR